MDARLAELERAFRDAPHDADTALALASSYLRVGKPASALTAARPHGDTELRRQAAARLGERLGVAFSHLTDEGFEAFHAGPADSVVLVPGGAFLDDGPQALRSSLLPGGSRSGLRPLTIGDRLVGRVAREERERDRAREAARAVGGRLPTPGEWKKAWRGGQFLDGDTTALVPNPSPDRMAPWGHDPAPEPGRHARSPYALEFMPEECEWSARRSVGLILDVDNGRYHVPVATPEQRRGRLLSWRLVIEIPRGL